MQFRLALVLAALLLLSACAIPVCDSNPGTEDGGMGGTGSCMEPVS